MSDETAKPATQPETNGTKPQTRVSIHVVSWLGGISLASIASGIVLASMGSNESQSIVQIAVAGVGALSALLANAHSENRSGK